MNNKNIPDFFLVGAAKAGSTAIAHYLGEHPEIYLSPIKETNYFSRADINPTYFRSLLKKRIALFDIEKYLSSNNFKPQHAAYITKSEHYLALFSKAGSHQLKGEASVSYLWSPSAPSEIFKANPNAKIIIILRNPIERAFSHYLMDLRVNFTNLSFADALKEDMQSPYNTWNARSNYIELGLYFIQVKRYLNLFPNDQIKIILFDDLKKNTKEVISSLYTFLGIDNNFVPDLDKKHNESYLYKNKFINSVTRNAKLTSFIRTILSPKIKNKILPFIVTKSKTPLLTIQERNYLIEYFKEDLKLLESIIKRDLSGWYK